TRSKRDWSSDVCSSDLIQKPSNHFIQGTGIIEFKLGRVLLDFLLFHISSHTGGRSSADLGNAQMEHPLSGFRCLTGGDNQARIRSEERRVGKASREREG